jgi:hypothetical protein
MGNRNRSDIGRAGDLETAKSVLREYINGIIGFPALGEALSKSPKSLMRMLSAQGNPQARNLFEIVAYFQKIEGWCGKCRLRRPSGRRFRLIACGDFDTL